MARRVCILQHWKTCPLYLIRPSGMHSRRVTGLNRAFWRRIGIGGILNRQKIGVQRRFLSRYTTGIDSYGTVYPKTGLFSPDQSKLDVPRERALDLGTRPCSEHGHFFKVDRISRRLILASQEGCNGSLHMEPLLEIATVTVSSTWKWLRGSVANTGRNRFLSRCVDCRENLPTTTLYPTKDSDGNPLETEYGLCRFKDHQTVTIQVQLCYFG